jgi:hypothetical protein
MDDEARTEEERIGFPSARPADVATPIASPGRMVLVPVALLGGSHGPRLSDSPAMDDPEVGGQASGGLRLERWQGRVRVISRWSAVAASRGKADPGAG